METYGGLPTLNSPSKSCSNSVLSKHLNSKIPDYTFQPKSSKADLNFLLRKAPSVFSTYELLKSLLLCSFTVEITDTDTELFQLGQFGHMRSFSTEDTVEIMIVFHPQ